MIGSCPVFPGNHYWNTPVDSLPLHPSSAAWVNSIGSTTRLHPDWGNVLSDNYGIPFVTVFVQQQGIVPLVYGPDGYPDESDLTGLSIPPNAPIEGGPASNGDRHVLVVDLQECFLYELYRAFPLNGGTSWRVDASAKFDLRATALRPAGWTSADAAGFAIFPGLVRWDESPPARSRTRSASPRAASGDATTARPTTSGPHVIGPAAARIRRRHPWARVSASRPPSIFPDSIRARR
jgi:hypothetical protein